MAQTYRKKLIEVALPLEAINVASAREKSIRHGHPSALHLWWARRPLAAARAVIFAQLVDDPSSHPELFPTDKAQEKERQRLFRIIEDLVIWENTNNEKVLNQARQEIWRSWRITCADNKNHPRAKELFNPEKLPGFHDPFAGGGALPLEAQRLGLESYASDLNPVAVLINKAMIEIPPRFTGKPPVNPESRKSRSISTWNGIQGLNEDVRFYGEWIRDEVKKRIGYLYPEIEITKEMVKEHDNLKPYINKKLTVIAWIWARTVKSPNPAFRNVDVPLISNFMLSTKEGKEVYVEPVIRGADYQFNIRVGKPPDVEVAKCGTKLARGANFRCVMSGSPIAPDYIKTEGKAGRIGARLIAIAAEGDRGRVYLSPTSEHENIAKMAEPKWKPEVKISGSTQYVGVKPYGIDSFSQLFTNRQLVALTTFTDVINETRELVCRDAQAAGFLNDKKPLRDGGVGATAYSETISLYLAFLISKLSDLNNNLTAWKPDAQCPVHLFARQAIPMVWDFAESNPLSDSSGSWNSMMTNLERGLDMFSSNQNTPGYAFQSDASSQTLSSGKVVSTDPPYYDNVPYADLSDFFYIWLRRSMKPVFPDIFATLAVPKIEELVAFAYRHDDKSGAEAFFLKGMTNAMHRLAEQAHQSFPVTIYYAFKQAENNGTEGITSTGWETFLDAVIRAGFATSGTWPMRTELGNRIRGMDSNALASSIILVCRPRAANASTITRREFITALKVELPIALAHLQRGNIAPVDLAQAAIGPGMATFTRYSKIMEADGSAMTVRMALGLINQILDEVLAEQEGEFDPDTRWALSWFEQHGMDEGSFGDADSLSKAKNTAVNALVEAGIIVARSGKVRLLKREDLSEDWNPTTDKRLTAWESTQYLIRSLEEKGGELGAAELLRKLGGIGDMARDLAYRLFNICERKKWPQEALAYNSLVLAWPEITKLAQGIPSAKPVEAEATLFDK